MSSITQSPANHQTLSYDVILIGGGIAGLWILNRLCSEGYNAVLLEQSSLGSAQTIASQGMIHGGIKYTLAGALNDASEAIADMPDHWRRCLTGNGDVSLLNTKTLSDHFYMWSTENVLSKATAFLASKTLRGRVDVLSPAEFPPVFGAATLKKSSFKGKIYRLVDSVIDTPSLLANLAANVAGRVFTIDWKTSRLSLRNNQVELLLNSTNRSLILQAQQFIFSAGKGNAELLAMISAEKPAMQLRPLQQVLVKHKNNFPLYAHCIGTDSVPRLTISSHRCSDGDMCWYLGGQLAEKGVSKNPQLLMREAKTEMEHLFPWLDWKNSQWATLNVERAEPQQKNLVRPDKAYIDRVIQADNNIIANALVAWPTKLTLSPNLGNEALALLKSLGTQARQHQSVPQALDFLPSPAIASSPWETASWLSSEELSSGDPS